MLDTQQSQGTHMEKTSDSKGLPCALYRSSVDWVRPHHKGGQPLPQPIILALTSSRNASTDMPEIAFNQELDSSQPSQVTHKLTTVVPSQGLWPEAGAPAHYLARSPGLAPAAGSAERGGRSSSMHASLLFIYFPDPKVCLFYLSRF